MRGILSRIGGGIRNAFNRMTGRGGASSATRGSGMSTGNSP